MKFMRSNGVRLLVWTAVAGGVIGCIVLINRAERDEMERLYPHLRTIRLGQERDDPWDPIVREQLAKELREGSPPQTNLWGGSFSIRATDLTAAQKTELARLFNEKFQPALEKWCAAYENRIPFKLEEVTLDKFHSTLGSRMFSFMIGDTTLTFLAPREPELSAKVGYLMVRQAALDMNRVPSSGFVPDLSVPVTREEIIRMVKVDSGIEFKPHDVRIRPTAKSTALNGGAFVDVLPPGADPNNGLDYNISMVFDADGKLVNYERNPNF
jgi:hypothetical protein